MKQEKERERKRERERERERNKKNEKKSRKTLLEVKEKRRKPLLGNNNYWT